MAASGAFDDSQASFELQEPSQDGGAFPSPPSAERGPLEDAPPEQEDAPPERDYELAPLPTEEEKTKEEKEEKEKEEKEEEEKKEKERNRVENEEKEKGKEEEEAREEKMEGEAARTIGENGKRGDGPGKKPGAGKGVPARADRNNKTWADHATLTMDHIDSAIHTRELIAKVAKAAFGVRAGSSDLDEIRGVAVRERHEVTGGFHLHCAVLCGKYHAPKSIRERARKADDRLRGLKEQPEMEPVRRGGKGSGRWEEKEKRGTGARWHLNVQFNHSHAESDKEVKAGKKKPGDYKCAYPFNEMVKYLLQPKKQKDLDASPLFINCSEHTIYHEDKQVDEPSHASLVAEARALKREGVMEAEAQQMLAEKCGGGPDTSGKLFYAMQAYRAEPRLRAPGYLPLKLREGDLLNARVLQIVVCRWLEDGPCREGCGLWLQCPPAAGKTTTQKLLQIRYPGQVYVAPGRAALGGFDETSLQNYDDLQHRIVWFNDLKPKKRNRDGRTDLGETLHRLLRQLTDGAPMHFTWAGKVFTPTPIAKIIVNATVPPPPDSEFLRRYLWVSVAADNKIEVHNPEISSKLGTPEENCLVQPRKGLEAAEHFKILEHVPEAASDEWRLFLLEFQSIDCFLWVLSRMLFDLDDGEPSRSFVDLERELVRDCEVLRQALQNKHDSENFDDFARNAGIPETASKSFKHFMRDCESFVEFRREVRARLTALPRLPPRMEDHPQTWCFALCLEWKEMRESGPGHNDEDLDLLEDVVEDWWGSAFGVVRRHALGLVRHCPGAATEASAAAA